MDAIDVAWCLGCDRHLDGAAAYCSKQCHNDHANIAAFPTRYQTPPPQRSHSQLFSYSPSVLSADDDMLQVLQNHPQLESESLSSKAAWIGKGDAGIHAWARDIPPGSPEDPSDMHNFNHASTSSSSSSRVHIFRQPDLILSQKRPVPPTLCMSKTHPAPPEPSRPILTPQQSLPSMSSRQHSITEASLTSLTTAVSSLSPATPASPASDALHDTDPPSAETQKPLTLMGNLTAHLRSWAVSSYHSGSRVQVRSPTVTRRPLEPAVGHYRPRSPVCMFPRPDQLTSFPIEKPRPLVLEKEHDALSSPALSHLSQPQRMDDHPAFRQRGRKAARVVS
ncbi:hypothetical protein EUX98_g1814 [Antrodiella citrinella]|uniref:Uncharacterized protein n=1 Tax=Antrodiella citrinella TaxID=2447956 RepID=A0A4S4N235_9APHY|nr:hypothetical protein EUX98_g1814 [Antrodiella citrinella]